MPAGCGGEPGDAGRALTLARKILRFVAEETAKSLLASASTQIGEAIGKRIGARIYTPPPEAEKTDEGKP